MTGKDRKTLSKIGRTPTPSELYAELMSSPGWEYKGKENTKLFYHCRDKALCAILYNGELRITEALRLTVGQFEDTPDVLFVKEVLLSKTRGKKQYRLVTLPKTGERALFTRLVLEYLTTLKQRGAKPETRLFPWSLKVKVRPVKRKEPDGTFTSVHKWKTIPGKETPLKSVQTSGACRAWQIVRKTLPSLTQHWLRVYGEKYLYRALGKDIMAVSKIVHVDARTAIKYVASGEEQFPVV